SELLPCHAAVARHEQPAARAAALASPGVDLELPHPGEEDARIARIHRDLRAAGVLVHEERALPRRAAVGRPDYAALRLRAVRGAQRECEDDLRVRGIDDDAPDAARLLETHAGPGLARVRRLVDAVANRDMTANPRLARARPNDVRIGRRDGKRADGLHRLVVEDLLPMHARVGRFRDAAGRATGVVHERVAGDADDRRDPVALWSNEAPAHPTVDIGTGPRGLTLRDQPGADRQQRDDDENQLLHRTSSNAKAAKPCEGMFPFADLAAFTFVVLLELVPERHLESARRMPVEARQIIRAIELVGSVVPLCIRAGVEDVEDPERCLEPACAGEVEFATDVELKVARGLMQHLALAARRISEAPCRGQPGRPR